MNEQVIQLLENYKDGVPVKIERSALISIALTELAVIVLGAIVVKMIQKL